MHARTHKAPYTHTHTPATKAKDDKRHHVEGKYIRVCNIRNVKVLFFRSFASSLLSLKSTVYLWLTVYLSFSLGKMRVFARSHEIIRVPVARICRHHTVLCVSLFGTGMQLTYYMVTRTTYINQNPANTRSITGARIHDVAKYCRTFACVCSGERESFNGFVMHACFMLMFRFWFT